MTPVAGTIARRLLSETTDMDSDGGTSTLGEAAHMGVWNMGASASAGGERAPKSGLRLWPLPLVTPSAAYPPPGRVALRGAALR